MATAACEQDSLCTGLLTTKKGRIREEKDPGVKLRYDEKVHGSFHSRNRRNMLIECGISIGNLVIDGSL